MRREVLDPVADGARKKLTEAARYWAGIREKPDDDVPVIGPNVVHELTAAGAPQHVIDAAQLQVDRGGVDAADEDFEVWADCWDTLMFFLALRGQWVHAAGGLGAVRTGLDFSRVESVMRLWPITTRKRPRLLRDLVAMELAVLCADRELANAAKDKEK